MRIKGGGPPQGGARETDTGKRLAYPRGHSEAIDTLAFSPEGQRLATASWEQNGVENLGYQKRTRNHDDGRATGRSLPCGLAQMASPPPFGSTGTAWPFLWDAASGEETVEPMGSRERGPGSRVARDGKTRPRLERGQKRSFKLWKRRRRE